MSDILQHKGYCGSIEYNEDSEILHGKVLFIKSLLSYEGNTIKQLKKDFEIAVNEYLADCNEMKKNPEIPFKGSFNVRVSPDLHRSASIFAIKKGIKLNRLVSDALNKYVSRA